MKVIFFGTPDFAVNTLECIIKSTHQVVAVVTQPDRLFGRSQELKFSAVKECALKHNIKCLQYDKVSIEGINDLKSLNADIFVTCAFGQILSGELINIPKFGVINVHASLLPKYRGASPIQHAVLNGDKETGITIMKTDIGLDTGDIILSEKISIFDDETSSQLFDRLSVLGGVACIKALDQIESGTAVYTKQNDQLATYVKTIKKQDAMLDFTKNCETIKNFVRGMMDWPCAFTYLNGKILKVFSVLCEADEKTYNDTECGVVLDCKNGISIRCKNGTVKILRLQLEGSKQMDAQSFVLGRKIKVGDKLGL